jgi:hypothetical protein
MPASSGGPEAPPGETSAPSDVDRPKPKPEELRLECVGTGDLDAGGRRNSGEGLVGRPRDGTRVPEKRPGAESAIEDDNPRGRSAPCGHISAGGTRAEGRESAEGSRARFEPSSFEDRNDVPCRGRFEDRRRIRVRQPGDGHERRLPEKAAEGDDLPATITDAKTVRRESHCLAIVNDGESAVRLPCRRTAGDAPQHGTATEKLHSTVHAASADRAARARDLRPEREPVAGREAKAAATRARRDVWLERSEPDGEHSAASIGVDEKARKRRRRASIAGSRLANRRRRRRLGARARSLRILAKRVHGREKCHRGKCGDDEQGSKPTHGGNGC